MRLKLKQFSLAALLIFYVLIPVLVFIIPNHTSADTTASVADINNATFTFKNNNVIEMTFGSQVLDFSGPTFQPASNRFSGDAIYTTSSPTCQGNNASIYVPVTQGFYSDGLRYKLNPTGAADPTDNNGRGFPNGQAELIMQLNTGAVGGGCTQIHQYSNIGNPANFDIYFVLSADASTIVEVSGQSTFKKSTTDPTLYTIVSSKGKAINTSGCADYIQISGTSYTLYEMTSGGNNASPPNNPEGPNCHLAGNVTLNAATNKSRQVDFDPNQDGNPTPGSQQGIGYSGAFSTITLPLGTDSANGTATTSAAQDPSLTDPNLQCHATWKNPLTWIMCPILTLAIDMVKTFDGFITQELEISTDQYLNDSGSSANQQTGAAFHQAWGIVRDVAMALLVVIALVMVISQAFGIGAFDAYAVKKVLPRLLIAVIFIALSWPLAKFAIDLSNDLGRGVRGIIYLPFHNFADPQILAGSSSIIGLAAAGAALTTVPFMAVFSFALTALAGVIIAVALLLFRQMLVLLLVILAPVAIACYILPGTQKAWKFWWDSFNGALLVFPIISAFIAFGRIFAKVAYATNTTLLGQVIVFAAYFGPYFLLPTAFKLASGIFSTLSGMANDRQRGFFDRQKKFRQRKYSETWADTKAGNRYKGEGALSRRLSSALQTGTLIPKAGLRPGRWGSNIRAARSTTNLLHAAETAEKDAAFQPIKGNDDLLAAATWGRGTQEDARDYLARVKNQSGRELEQNLSHIAQAKRSMGQRNFAVAAAVANAATGTGYGSGPGEMLEAINFAAGGDMTLAGNMLAQAKSKAEGARRYDLSGAGFGDMYGQLQAINTAPDPHAAAAVATEFLVEKALDAQGPGAMLAGRGQSVENLVPAMERRINKKMSVLHDLASNDPARMIPHTVSDGRGGRRQMTIVEAQRDMQQVLASTAGLLDVASQVSPENARRLADGVLSATLTDVNKQQATVGQIIEANRGNQQFQEMRREYGQGTQQQYAAAQQRAAMAGPPGAPPGGPPVGPPPGP